MKASRIELNIERLTLDGFSLTGAQAHALRGSLETELSRLLTEGGTVDAFSQGIAVPSLPPLSVSFGAGASPADMGRDLARTLYAGLRPGPPLEPRTVEKRRPSPLMLR
jgi:hypothetical protein